MECKGGYRGQPEKVRTGFNRNIVECKVKPTFSPRKEWVSFNRNIVECKAVIVLINYLLGCVLIETLWNVNNGDPDAGNALRVGFNRNIVECEFLLHSC